MSTKKRKRGDLGSLSGPIVDCFRKQIQQEGRNVECPMCNCLVLHKSINEHLDRGCKVEEGDGRSGSSRTDCENVKCIADKVVIKLEDNDVDLEDVDSTFESKSTDEINNGLGIENLLKDEEHFLAEIFPSKDSMDSDIKKDYSVQSSFGDDKHLKDSTETTASSEPYYLHNFMLTVKTVLEQHDDKELFNDRDNNVVKSFKELSDKAKMLYVRLFQRKYMWFRTNKIEYPRISESLQPYFDELIKTGFLQTEAALTDLMEILNLLSASDIQDLAKYMHMVTSKTKSKKQLVDVLMRVSKRQCSIFSTNGHNTQEAIKKRAKLLLGSCVKLESGTRNVFSRIILLFTMNMLQNDDSNYGTQLSSLFLINIGRIVYPSYEISRQTKVFQDRDDVISYDLANQDLCHMDEAIENKDFDQALEIYGKVHVQFMVAIKKLSTRDPRLIHSVSLPVHLRCFTSTWLFTKMCSKGVDLLQRNKQYIEAVDLLRVLLYQQEFCVTHRGWWWERLALNLDHYLKKPAEALDAVRKGLADTRVRTGHRLALEQRAKMICETKRNSSLKKHLTAIKFTELRKPKIVTISGKRLPNEPMFVLPEMDSDGGVNKSYAAVEVMALRYYRQQGYNEGIHGEGITFNTLFALLMWDVIFNDSVPDVFRTPFQLAPLDIYCENFYQNRKEIIDERLAEIRSASVEQMTEWIKATWLKQEGKTAVGIKWDLFTGLEQITELARCIGSEVMAGICERFAKDYRHTRSGLPDLVVWNSKTHKYKIAEVKGPNDRLSTKQHVWLDVLVKLGVDAEVLYVKAVGGRNL